MVDQGILYSHITAAAAWSYVMDHAMRSPKLSFIRRDTPKVNAAIRVVTATLTSAGIGWVWGGHWNWSQGSTLTINLPAIGLLVVWLWHAFGQYAMQHFGERLLDIGRTWKIDPQVLGQLAQAVANELKQLPAPKA